MARNILISVLALLTAAGGHAETVRGRITPSSSSHTYGFSPHGAQIELTLMWVKRPVILNLWVQCRDEIGSLFFDATSESNGDRIERFDFGGWDGARCTVTVYDLDGTSRTRYLLSLRAAFDGTLPREDESVGTGALLTSIDIATVPGMKDRLARHRARSRRHAPG